jgi:hypothetical protein
METGVIYASSGESFNLDYYVRNSDHPDTVFLTSSPYGKGEFIDGSIHQLWRVGIGRSPKDYYILLSDRSRGPFQPSWAPNHWTVTLAEAALGYDLLVGAVTFTEERLVVSEPLVISRRLATLLEETNGWADIAACCIRAGLPCRSLHTIISHLDLSQLSYYMELPIGPMILDRDVLDRYYLAPHPWETIFTPLDNKDVIVATILCDRLDNGIPTARIARSYFYRPDLLNEFLFAHKKRLAICGIDWEMLLSPTCPSIEDRIEEVLDTYAGC